MCPCISANRHATAHRYKRSKNGSCKGDCISYLYILTQKFHKTKAHDEMTEICRCYKSTVKKVIFAQLFSGIVNENNNSPCV